MMFRVKPGFQHWGLCFSRDLAIVLDSIPYQDVKEPLRTTSMLAVTTLSATIEMLP